MNGHYSAKGHDLGELIQEYRADSLQQLLCVVSGLAFVALGLFFLWIAISSGDSLAIVGGVGGVCLLMPMGGLVLWCAFFYMTGLRVLLFEHGFVYQQGRQRQLFRWEEIESVHLTETEHVEGAGPFGNPYTYYSHSFRIRATGGREIVLDDTIIFGGEALGRIIMREQRHFQLKELLRQALQLEAAGERGAALAAFEQLVRESPYNKIAEQAKEHIQRLREHGSGAGSGETVIQGGRPFSSPVLAIVGRLPVAPKESETVKASQPGVSAGKKWLIGLLLVALPVGLGFLAALLGSDHWLWIVGATLCGFAPLGCFYLLVEVWKEGFRSITGREWLAGGYSILVSAVWFISGLSHTQSAVYVENGTDKILVVELDARSWLTVPPSKSIKTRLPRKPYQLVVRSEEGTQLDARSLAVGPTKAYVLNLLGARTYHHWYLHKSRRPRRECP